MNYLVLGILLVTAFARAEDPFDKEALRKRFIEQYAQDPGSERLPVPREKNTGVGKLERGIYTLAARKFAAKESPMEWLDHCSVGFHRGGDVRKTADGEEKVSGFIVFILARDLKPPDIKFEFKNEDASTSLMFAGQKGGKMRVLSPKSFVIFPSEGDSEVPALTFVYEKPDRD